MSYPVRFKPTVNTRYDGVLVGRGVYLDSAGEEIDEAMIDPATRARLVARWQAESGAKGANLDYQTKGTASGAGGPIPPKQIAARDGFSSSPDTGQPKKIASRDGHAPTPAVPGQPKQIAGSKRPEAPHKKIARRG